MVSPTLLRYSYAVAAVALATVARLVLDPSLDGRQPCATFYFALLFAAWYGGLGPTLLAVGLGSLLADYFFIPPATASDLPATPPPTT